MQFSAELSDLGYSASIEFSDASFGDVNVELSFVDLTNNLVLARCEDQISLSKVSANLQCALTLRSSRFVSGTIFATYGLNVVDGNGSPLPGAIVSVCGEDVAITDGNSSFAQVTQNCI